MSVSDEGTEGKVHAQTHKDKQRHHLECETSHHDVCASLRAPPAVTFGACEPTSAGLKQKRDEIAGDEDARIGTCCDTGVFGAEDDDDAGEGQVEAGSEEGRSDCETADLYEIAVLHAWSVWLAGTVIYSCAYLAERIVPAHDSADVTHKLAYTAGHHGDGEA